MLAADASFSSVGPSYNVRTRDGPAHFDSFYLGPEVQAFGADDNYRQLRAGLHATGFRTGGFEWSVGAGWATDTDDRSCAYGKLAYSRDANQAFVETASRAIVMAISIKPASASVS